MEAFGIAACLFVDTQQMAIHSSMTHILLDLDVLRLKIELYSGGPIFTPRLSSKYKLLSINQT